MTDLKTLITELQKPVTYKWKIQAVPKNWKKGNCVAYIDSRDCMNALDHNCLEWWQNEFYEVKWKVFCRVWIKINWEWQWRSDSGALESSEHIEEETTSKWETSDAFKRACVQWGIGRFLYEKDIIWISEEDYNANKFKINEWCLGKEKWTNPHLKQEPKIEDDWITLQDYIESMKLAKTPDELKNLFMAGQKKCKTQTELDNFAKIKDEKKKDFDVKLA